MTKRQQNRLINQSNRIAIAVLTLSGIVLDGLQFADVLLELAVVLWLWMPECRLLEHTLVRRIHGGYKGSESRLRPL